MLSLTGQGDGTFIGADIFGVKEAAPGGYLDTAQAGDGVITQYFAWDANSQLLARRDDNANVTQYIFDNQDRITIERKAIYFTGTSFTVVGGDSVAFTSFRAGVAPVSTRPGFTDITFSYDRDSNVVTRVDEANNAVVATYDGLSRHTGVSITPASSFIGTTLQDWTFDGLSRQTSSFDNNEPDDANDDVSTAALYDSLSRLIEEQQRIGTLSAKAVSYQFSVAASNSVFHTSALVYADGRQVNNAYDNLDRLVSRTDNGQSSPIGNYEYIGWRVATLTFQNQTRVTYFAGNIDAGYDGLRRPVKHRWESFTPSDPLGAGNLLVGFAYTYNRANNRLSQEKLHDPNNSELYSYRSDYELISFERGTLNATKTAIVTPTGTAGALQNQNWNLDGTRNWTANTHTTGGVTGTENRSHSNVNEIATLSGSPYGENVNATYVYDDNGNLLDDGVRLYKWDALGRLQQVFRKSDGLLIADYSYASDNRRFRKTVTNGGLDGTSANGTTDFYWSGWQTIEERDTLDLLTQQYVYGIGVNELWTLDDRRVGILVAQLNDGLLDERKFYHQDVLGSVYALSNETGQILVGFQYDAYGLPTEFGQAVGGQVIFGSNVLTVGTTVPANPYLYAGYRHDGETFVFYVNARYYSADQGRFVSRDPIFQVNLYDYVANDPANAVDPLGMQKTRCLDVEEDLFEIVLGPTEVFYGGVARAKEKAIEAMVEIIKEWKARENQKGGMCGVDKTECSPSQILRPGQMIMCTFVAKKCAYRIIAGAASPTWFGTIPAYYVAYLACIVGCDEAIRNPAEPPPNIGEEIIGLLLPLPTPGKLKVIPNIKKMLPSQGEFEGKLADKLKDWLKKAFGVEDEEMKPPDLPDIKPKPKPKKR